MVLTESKQLYSCRHMLTAGECNAQREMQLQLLASRIIEIATFHANYWGVGYAKLLEHNQAWVLSRMAIEMTRFPKVGEHYTLTTWVENYNRHFSERHIEIKDDNGNVLGYARTIWAVIDITTRSSCDITAFEFMRDNILAKECPIERQSRFKTVNHLRESSYTFRSSDIDFNRHVNTLRYIGVLLNQWNVDFYDKHRIHRFEISFSKECRENEEVTIGIDDSTDECLLEIVHDNVAVCKAKFIFENR